MPKPFDVDDVFSSHWCKMADDRRPVVLCAVEALGEIQRDETADALARRFARLLLSSKPGTATNDSCCCEPNEQCGACKNWAWTVLTEIYPPKLPIDSASPGVVNP